MVLATDLSKHFDFISQLKVTPEAALSPEGHTSQSSLDVNLLLTVAIKFVDIGHSYKPWAQHEQWSHWVTEEPAPTREALHHHHHPTRHISRHPDTGDRGVLRVGRQGAE